MSEKDYVPKLDELVHVGEQVNKLLKGHDYVAAAFVVDNLPGDYDKSALYAGLAMSVVKELDSADLKKDSPSETLASQILAYCASKSSHLKGQE